MLRADHRAVASWKFGAAAEEVSGQWIDAGAVHFLASDAHNVTSRPLRLKEAFEHVAKTQGEDAWPERSLIENPLAAFEGRPLPYVPELADDAGGQEAGSRGRRRKRFWFF